MSVYNRLSRLTSVKSSVDKCLRIGRWLHATPVLQHQGNAPRMRTYPGPRRDVGALQGAVKLPDLVSFLDEMAVRDICVVELPADRSYSDHMVICSCVSPRHLSACGMEVKKFVKRHLDADKVQGAPWMEGCARSGDFWLAIDCGSLVLHLFESSRRRTYDLETLWAVGAKFDERACSLRDLAIE